MAAEAETNGRPPTFIGEGFGTLLAHAITGTQETPETASSRKYLRDALPALYREDDFGMRFVGALESVLDPIIAVLDALPFHFDPDHAPRDVLVGLSAWLGVELEEGQTVEQRRELVRRAAELGRRRGTVGGIELALRLGFPGVSLRVQDEGGVVWSLEEKTEPAPPQRFVVYCDDPVPEDRQAAIARCIERVKPAHVGYRLRVRRTEGAK
jgi:phage tail-like protein